MRPYTPYIPQSPGEVWDLLGSMILGAPRFEDTSGYFHGKNIETEFQALTEGLGAIRKKLGEERYARLITLSAKAKAVFLQASEDKLDEVRQGCALLLEMEDVLNEIRRRKPPTDGALG